MVGKAWSIILGANRPLTLSEMNIAVKTNTDASSPKALDLESETHFQANLRSLCGLFVSVYHGKIHFLHQTAREFLFAPPSPPATLIPDSAWHHTITTLSAHQVLAEVCVTYLDLFNVTETFTSPTGECLNCVDYSAKYWAGRFREASFNGPINNIRRATRTCNPH